MSTEATSTTNHRPRPIGAPLDVVLCHGVQLYLDNARRAGDHGQPQRAGVDPRSRMPPRPLPADRQPVPTSRPPRLSCSADARLRLMEPCVAAETGRARNLNALSNRLAMPLERLRTVGNELSMQGLASLEGNRIRRLQADARQGARLSAGRASCFGQSLPTVRCCRICGSGRWSISPTTSTQPPSRNF
jgi:hypothetical protein